MEGFDVICVRVGLPSSESSWVLEGYDKICMQKQCGRFFFFLPQENSLVLELRPMLFSFLGVWWVKNARILLMRLPVRCLVWALDVSSQRLNLIIVIVLRLLSIHRQCRRMELVTWSWFYNDSWNSELIAFLVARIRAASVFLARWSLFYCLVDSSPFLFVLVEFPTLIQTWWLLLHVWQR